MKNKTVAIVGATGAVGREFVGCIEARGLPLESLKLLASAKLGRQDPELSRRGTGDRGTDATMPFTASTSRFSRPVAPFPKQFAPVAVKAGAVVVDNSFGLPH